MGAQHRFAMALQQPGEPEDAAHHGQGGGIEFRGGLLPLPQDLIDAVGVHGGRIA